ncbi:MAG: DUF6497 family protein [Paracoccus sp. (in: a-proteobacteria)]|nr:DUF6497 family protein [Paracoccus sp. (in: a-proteobacteria)]
MSASAPRFAPLFLALLLPAPPAMASPAPGQGVPVAVPSGQAIFWQDMVAGRAAGGGLSYRFRFIAPGLAYLVPPGPAMPMEELTDEETEPTDDPARNAAQAPPILLDAPGTGLPAPAVPAPSGAETGPGGPALNAIVPPAPEALLRDPMHDDLHWLCENFALPRIARPGPRPSEIVISLSDRALDSTGLVPGAVQLFETFTLPPDRDICIWRPY